MKKFKTITLVLFICLGLNATAQKGSTMSKEDVKKELIEGFAKFVESVRPFYEKGNTFKQFKNKVFFGSTSANFQTIPTLPPEGETMLRRAYDYLSKGYSFTQIVNIGDYETMGNAVLLYDREHKKVGGNAVQSNIEAILFGGSTTVLNSNPMIANRGGCRWWQLHCHLNEIFGDEGGSTILGAIITVILILLGGG